MSIKNILNVYYKVKYLRRLKVVLKELGYTESHYEHFSMYLVKKYCTNNTLLTGKYGVRPSTDFAVMMICYNHLAFDAYKPHYDAIVEVIGTLLCVDDLLKELVVKNKCDQFILNYIKSDKLECLNNE